MWVGWRLLGTPQSRQLRFVQEGIKLWDEKQLVIVPFCFCPLKRHGMSCSAAVECACPAPTVFEAVGGIEGLIEHQLIVE